MDKLLNNNKDEFEVDIGRGSKWNNPYVISDDLTREESINLYRAYLFRKIKSSSITIEMLLYLKGKKLGCHCEPLPCHVDVIIDAIKWAEQEQELKSISCEYSIPINFAD